MKIKLFNTNQSSSKKNHFLIRDYATISHTKGFETLYRQKLLPQINRIANFRSEIWRKFLTASMFILIGTIIIMTLLTFFTRMESKEIYNLAFASIFIILLVPVFIYFSYKKRYNKKYKEAVASTLIKNIDEKTTYSPDKYILQNEFAASNLFHQKVKAYNGEDLIEATVDQIKTKFSKVSAKREKVIIKKNKKAERETDTFFSGIFYVADFYTNLEGSIYFFSHWELNSLVEFECPAFKEYFRVYCTDLAEATSFLTNDFLKRVLSLYENPDFKSLRLSISNNKIYMAFELRNDNNKYRVGEFVQLLDAPRLWGSPDYNKILKTDYNCLNSILNIVEILNLNGVLRHNTRTS